MGAFRRRLMFSKPEEPVEYFKFTALENGTFTLTIGSAVSTSNLSYMEYSVDDGETWVKTDNVDSTEVIITTPTVSTGDSVLWRGSGLRMATGSNYLNTDNSVFSSTGQCNVSGNIKTLLGLDKPKNLVEYDIAYKCLFLNMTTLVDASGLILTGSFTASCFRYLFKGCSSLIYPPELPSTATAEHCCEFMFYGCISLRIAPELQSTSLVSSCYRNMFDGCTSLTTAPTLPATTMASYCYYAMFSGCTSLTSAPALPAKSLASYCYQGMFYGCSALTSAPALPATTMSSSCYREMFCYCSSLTTAPVLPAITLTSSCYRYMFQYCRSLNYIKALFTTTPGTYTTTWVSNVASTGIFVKNINATWTDTGTSAVPSSWTIIYYDPSDEKYYTDQQKTTECDDHGNPL